jgi:hypothetical protein
VKIFRKSSKTKKKNKNKIRKLSKKKNKNKKNVLNAKKKTITKFFYKANILKYKYNEQHSI